MGKKARVVVYQLVKERNQPGVPPETRTVLTGDLSSPCFLSDLARLEGALRSVQGEKHIVPVTAGRPSLNPALQLLKLSWQNLPSLFHPAFGTCSLPAINPGEEFVLVLRHPKTGESIIRSASREDLLALKLTAEQIDAASAAREGKVSTASILAVIRRAVSNGLLLAPPSAIRRTFPDASAAGGIDESFLSCSIFTLQWHITQSCDLHCRHCYDRSKRADTEYSRGLALIEDFTRFCSDRSVAGQISFSGGNPFLHPHFRDFYGAAVNAGLTAAILGNPVSPRSLEEIVAIEPPVFYQVSLEGLQEHNDLMRGRGHFQRTLEFLDTLRQYGVYSMVMLTLTKTNLDQILPLAEKLSGRADLFTFNRLAMVGEGAKLQLPSKEKYEEFLQRYIDAAEENSVLALKDNLINILHHKKGMPLFGGCAGYGCGAAFNFVSVLPDGEVHACRKFPSLIGNLQYETLSQIYDSESARAYRAGSRACRDCAIRPVCGGCLASSYSFGLDVLNDRDPFCFMRKEPVLQEPCNEVSE